jgi:hypothetical protein
MAKIKIKDLPKDVKISGEESRRIYGGFGMLDVAYAPWWLLGKVGIGIYEGVRDINIAVYDFVAGGTSGGSGGGSYGGGGGHAVRPLLIKLR